MDMMTENLLGCAVVIAQFNGTPQKDYAYFVPAGDDPKVGDVILTSTNWDTFMAEVDDDDHDDKIDDVVGTKVPQWQEVQKIAMEARPARVIDVIPEGGHPKATRFYMQLLSIKKLRQTHKHNTLIAAQAKERAAAQRKLDAMLARRSKLSVYRELAVHDPEAARLLAIVEGKLIMPPG